LCNLRQGQESPRVHLRKDRWSLSIGSFAFFQSAGLSVFRRGWCCYRYFFESISKG
jgi:hypothetical protein